MQEMLQNLNSPSSSNLSVLERQRSRLQWQQSFESLNETNNFSFDSLISLPISPQNLNSDQYFSNDCSASSLKHKKEGTSKKRKAGKSAPATSNQGEKEKRSKDEDSPEKFTENGSPLPPPPPPKQDFIHVRARRGQATDSHSLAERVRRERISERMKYLQDLVPGCSKIIGKAGMLDEIINYVQSLQRQVEFLSMKLATVNPLIDFNIDSFFPKENTIDASAEMIETYLQMNTMHQMAACCGLNIDFDASELALRRSLSSSIAIHDAFLDASFNVHDSSWDANSQRLCDVEFHQGKGSMLPLQSLSGSYSPNNLKREM